MKKRITVVIDEIRSLAFDRSLAPASPGNTRVYSVEEAALALTEYGYPTTSRWVREQINRGALPEAELTWPSLYRWLQERSADDPMTRDMLADQLSYWAKTNRADDWCKFSKMTNPQARAAIRRITDAAIDLIDRMLSDVPDRRKVP